MRQFVIAGHDAPTQGGFDLDNLASGAGRLDLLARSLLAGLLISHDIRQDTKIHLIFSDAITIRFYGEEIQSLYPDERSAAALIRSVLKEADRTVGEQPIEASPGIQLRLSGFKPTLRRIADDGTLIHLDRDGTHATAVDPPKNPIFVLSDHQPFPEADRDVLENLADQRLSLGPEVLHTDQAIPVAHNWCDTDGWAGW